MVFDSRISVTNESLIWIYFLLKTGIFTICTVQYIHLTIILFFFLNIYPRKKNVLINRTQRERILTIDQVLKLTGKTAE